MSGTREATHAGSWYDASKTKLSAELDDFLDRVPEQINGSDLPIKGARVIIAPHPHTSSGQSLTAEDGGTVGVHHSHAGYSYSGRCAAWAYKILDLTGASRVFILGPSHTYYLSGCALSTFETYETPLGDLRIDLETVAALRSTSKFANIPPHRDEDEHSLEMHLPYLAKRLTQTFGPETDAWPPIVPILVGDNKRDAERAFGELLAPYLADPANRFIVSSDFCHWGSRFSYQAYTPDGKEASVRALSSRRASQPAPSEMSIHDSISALDHLAMAAIESGSHDAFVDNLKATGNTVCGRHPIGVAMAALEALRKKKSEGAAAASAEEKSAHASKPGDGVFAFVNYDRSGLVKAVDQSSVSYAAAYAVV